MEQRTTHICNRVREFSAKICGQLKITQFDENTISRPTQFGDMKQELPKRKYLSAWTFASNPWMRGFAPPMPTSSTASEMLESYIRQMPTEELKRFNLFLQHPFTLVCYQFFGLLLSLRTFLCTTSPVCGLITWNLVLLGSMA
jgi:hypothetical protein